MGLLSALFGAPTVADDAVKTVGNLVDQAFFTDQEKSAAAQKRLDWYLDLQKTLTQESTGTSLARRWFLLAITLNTFALAWVYLVADVAGYPDICAAILRMVDVFRLGWAFTAAVSFYFLTHAFDAMKQ